MAADELLGVIHVDTTRQDKRFNREDLELFTAVANQTALAISYSGMHRRLRRRQRIEHDLAMARHMQTSFLPDALPELSGMEFSVTYRAALEVGGDFYDFIPLKDGRLGIVLGDVMGKGMPAALMMVRMMSDVRSLALSDPEPARVLQGLNESLVRRGTTDTFVTGLFLVLDPATREVTFANAAHLPPLLRRGSSGEVRQVAEAESGLCLGVEEGTRYAQETITLNPGDCLLSYTDGLTEAQNVQLDYYGSERLLKSVEVPEATPTVLMQAVLDAMRGFVGETPQSDDLTILCFGAI